MAEEQEFTRQEGFEGFQSHPQLNIPKKDENPRWRDEMAEKGEEKR